MIVHWVTLLAAGVVGGVWSRVRVAGDNRSYPWGVGRNAR